MADSREVKNDDYGFVHDSGAESFSFWFGTELVAKMNAHGIELYGEHATDKAARAFWATVAEYSPFKKTIERLTRERDKARTELEWLRKYADDFVNGGP